MDRDTDRYTERRGVDRSGGEAVRLDTAETERRRTTGTMRPDGQYDTRSDELSDLQTELQLEQVGLNDLNTTLEGSETTESGLQGDVNQKQQSYDTAYDEATQAANVAAPDPDLLVAGESVVEETLTAPDGSTIEAGEVWTAEVHRDTVHAEGWFHRAVHPRGPDRVGRGSGGRAWQQTSQLSAASTNVTNATDDRDQQAEVVETAEKAVDDKQDEVDSAWGTLQQESLTDLSLAQGALEAADAEGGHRIDRHYHWHRHRIGTGRGSRSRRSGRPGRGPGRGQFGRDRSRWQYGQRWHRLHARHYHPDAPSIDSWATDTNITDDGVTYDNTLTVSVTGEPGGTPRRRWLYVRRLRLHPDVGA